METIGVHVNLTSPSRGKKQEKIKYKQHTYDLLTTILSALKWKEKNGKIKLYTDIDGYNYYKDINLLDLWNAGIEIFSQEDISHQIDTNLFWAIGKIYAIKKQNAPFCLFDIDIIVWENISNFLKNKDIVCVHRESIKYNDAYLSLEHYPTKNGYVFDPQWGYEEDACNTAIIYFENNDFKNIYCDEVIRFAENSISPSGTYLDYQMVFAEQRMLPMIAKKMNVPIYNIFDNYFPTTQNNLITHIWGSKILMKNHKNLLDDFAQRCITRIIVDFPEWKDKLLNIDELSDYHNFIGGFEV